MPAPQPPTVAGMPPERGRLIGRDDEVARLWQVLHDADVVSVVGPGGVGKSRVAMQVVGETVAQYPDGVWWCELAQVEEGADVDGAAATTVGVRADADGTAADALVRFLAERRALVVLDNAEHVAPAVETLARRLTDGCPTVTILVTSRTPVRSPAEVIYRLPPLAVDGVGDGEAVSPALELFLERGQAARPDLDLHTASERDRILEICRRLDGLPLALELTASRLRALNPTDLATRLEGRLDLIGDPGTDRGRHQTLVATLDWSYGLLSVTEQRLFDRLSVFAGPFTLDAVEAVAAGDGIARDEILDLLTRLVDDSLVTVHAGAGQARYGLLENLRTYGREHLGSTGDGRSLRRRHAEYYTALAEDADRQVRSREERAGVERLDREIANLRAAHRWTLEHDASDLGPRLVAALFPFALFRLRAEVLAWAAPVAELADAEVSPLFPTVAGVAGWAAGLRGDLDLALRWVERASQAATGQRPENRLVAEEIRMHIALWRGELEECLVVADGMADAVRDPYDLMPRYVPALALTYAGRPEEALTRIDELQPEAERFGNPTMRSLVAYTRGEALLVLDPPRALRPLQDSADLASEVDNRMVLGVTDVSLASLRARHGDARDAASSFLGIIDRLHGGGDWTHLWTGLRSLVVVLAQLGDVQTASVLLGAVREAESAPPLYGEDETRLDALAHELEQRSGARAFAAAYAKGCGLGGGQAVDLARTAIASAGARAT